VNDLLVFKTLAKVSPFSYNNRVTTEDGIVKNGEARLNLPQEPDYLTPKSVDT